MESNLYRGDHLFTDPPTFRAGTTIVRFFAGGGGDGGGLSLYFFIVAYDLKTHRVNGLPILNCNYSMAVPFRII